MSAQTPVDQDSPLWKAWEEYTGTEDFANSLRWLARGSPTAGKGEMWAAFCAGWNATDSADEITRLRARNDHLEEDYKAIEDEVIALEEERDALRARVEELEGLKDQIQTVYNQSSGTEKRGLGTALRVIRRALRGETR